MFKKSFKNQEFFELYHAYGTEEFLSFDEMLHFMRTHNMKPKNTNCRYVIIIDPKTVEEYL